MDLFEKTLKICKENNIKPARSRGQNFLIKESVYDSIIAGADLKEDDVVLEVGPGLGFLTEKLSKKVKKVIAVELDDKLANILKFKFKKEGIDNIEVLNENVLDLVSNFQFSIINDQSIKNYKIVANLPYNITSIFLRKFLEADNKPQSRTLMLQKEVAERIVASPGKMSLLAVSVQYYAEPKIIKYVAKEDFWPVPAVDSAVIQLIIKTTPTLPFAKGGEKASLPFNKGDLKILPFLKGVPRRGEGFEVEKDFFRLVKHGFSSKRKMLKNNLAGAYQASQEEIEKKLTKIGLNTKARAQELSLDDWKNLSQEF